MIKKILKVISATIFYASFIYYIYWIPKFIYGYFYGFDRGWLVPSLSSGRKIYGLDAICEEWDLFVFITIIFFQWIPIYELIYLAIHFIKKKRNKEVLK